jgi:hypothetical protein
MPQARLCLTERLLSLILSNEISDAADHAGRLEELRNQGGMWFASSET